MWKATDLHRTTNYIMEGLETEGAVYAKPCPFFRLQRCKTVSALSLDHLVPYLGTSLAISVFEA